MNNINVTSDKHGIRERNSHELYWDDLNKGKFLSLLTASSLVVRTCFHPLGLIKVRLQTSTNGGLSTVHMIKQIWYKEGSLRGLYRGFPISLSSLIFEPVFTGILEQMRTVLKNNRPNQISSSQWDIITGTLSGCVAALIYQSLTVPLDVTAQRIMITKTRDGVHVTNIIRDIYYRSGDGFCGFYKGYMVSLSMSIPFNSIIWTMYWQVQAKLERIVPYQHNQLVAPLSAIIASLLTSLLTQPIDVLKTRLQVAAKRQSLWRTFQILIDERGFRGCFSGSLPRACTIVPYYLTMMSLYEVIKRASVRSISN
ncbi:unnamed protein product [Rotaria magnacalcarata]|uniref:Solute carrier family 25 member 44 n=1 Tax=Rotaria magnacalcarata TaxID=392030 RepID=A0A816P1F0_9BILA|nr:unnamed protein product [Rotaria magnacalcarata]CAF1581151.1 unnamed protein product [Rotaria magnacalcarata]CAF2042870.1 unnamed protein product [Rotaria magnacalcarata]CAF2109741.1 unnamed protein product [Rotaria magnacalcarata]CAF2124788.1 unnamed protein product [Rotaria magnacalcarata]